MVAVTDTITEDMEVDTVAAMEGEGVAAAMVSASVDAEVLFTKLCQLIILKSWIKAVFNFFNSQQLTKAGFYLHEI